MKQATCKMADRVVKPLRRLKLTEVDLIQGIFEWKHPWED